MTNTSTPVRPLSRSAIWRAMLVGRLCLVAVVCVLGNVAVAQGPPVHPLHAGVLQPGAIGSQQLLRGGPLSSFSPVLAWTQPTEIRVPAGIQIGLQIDGQFTTPELDNPVVGLRVGGFYRFRIANVFDRPGVELYPTVELIDRLYPPPGHALRFPVPVDITAEELEMAARGMYVTRVIYVEDPSQALPTSEVDGKTTWYEAADGEDPLEVADRAGRPIAILRLGGRDLSHASDRLSYGCPPLVEYGRNPSAE